MIQLIQKYCNLNSYNIKDKWNRIPARVCIENGEFKALELFNLTIEEINNIKQDINNERNEFNKVNKKSKEQIRNIQSIFNNELMNTIINRKQISSSSSFISDLKDNNIIKLKSNSNNSNKIIVRNIFSKQEYDSSIEYSINNNNNNNNNNSKIIISKVIEYPGDIESIKSMIIDPKYDVAGKDMFGLTVLHKLSSWDQSHILDIIIEHLTANDMNMISSPPDCFTALHFCIDMNAENSLLRFIQDERWVQGGLDFSIKDSKGRSPLEYATYKENDRFIQLLQSI
jgi:hypothetical protein